MPLYNAWPYEYGKTLAVRQTHNTSTTLAVRQTHNTSTTMAVRQTHNTSTNKRKKKLNRNKRIDSLSSKKPEVVTQAQSDKTVAIVVPAKTDNKTNVTNRKETKNKEAKAESDKAVTSVVSVKTDNETNETNHKETKNKEAKAQSDKTVTSVVSTSHNVNQSQLSIENKGIAKEEPISRKRKATNIDSEQDDVLEPVSKKPRTNYNSEQDDIHEPVCKKPRQANFVDIPSNVIRKTVLKEVNTDQTIASQEINVANVNNLTDNNKIISKETSKTSSVKRKIEGSCLGETSVRGASILSTTVFNKETNFETVANVKRADFEGVNGDDKRLSTQFDMAEQKTEGPTRSIKEQTRTPRPYE